MARKRFNFWLDDKNTTDWQINEIIVNLKKAGQFTRAIREGLRLWTSFRAGQTDVLCELFPKIAEQLGAVRLPPEGSDGGGQSNLAREIAAQIVLMGGTSGYVMQSAMPSLPAPQKPATAPPVAVVSKAAEASADEIASNFLSMF